VLELISNGVAFETSKDLEVVGCGTCHNVRKAALYSQGRTINTSRDGGLAYAGYGSGAPKGP